MYRGLRELPLDPTVRPCGEDVHLRRRGGDDEHLSSIQSHVHTPENEAVSKSVIPEENP